MDRQYDISSSMHSIITMYSSLLLYLTFNVIVHIHCYYINNGIIIYDLINIVLFYANIQLAVKKNIK